MTASIIFADRVRDTSTTTGTGNFTLSGTAPTGFVDFNTAFGTAGQRFAYCIDAGTAEWEVGVGYLSTSTTLVREEITASSNAGAAVSFSAGSKTVFNTIPARSETATTRRGRALAFAMQNWRP